MYVKAVHLSIVAGLNGPIAPPWWQNGEQVVLRCDESLICLGHSGLSMSVREGGCVH